jgi:hypothetical protein
MVIANPGDVDEEALNVKLIDIKEICDQRNGFDAIKHLGKCFKACHSNIKTKAKSEAE